MSRLAILVFFCFTAFSGCKDKAASEDGIYGEWKLEDYCRPDASNSCQEISVPESKSVIISFKAGGDFMESYKNTIPVDYAFMGCGGGKFTFDGEAVYLQLMCMSSTFPRKVLVVKHTRNELILKPYETGEFRFRRL